MALFIPLLVPPLAKITAGIAVGLANAAQGEKSNFSLTIGNKVFSTSQPFPFNALPFELRSQILLEALELSKALLPPPPPPLPAGHPFVTPSHPLYHHPGNPHNPAYVAPSGERARNGYPTSAWRWITLSREWWAVLRPVLWRDVVLKGDAQYKGFLALCEDADSCFIKGFVKSVDLREGFEPWEMYSVLRHLPDVEAVTYAPYPRETHLFPFGLNILPTTPGPKRITIDKLPFDRITTPSTRAHLRALPRLEALTLQIGVLTPALGALLASLPHLRELTLHLPTLHPSALAPFTTHPYRGAPHPGADADTPHWQRPARPHAASQLAAAADEEEEDEEDGVHPARGQHLRRLELHARVVHADHVEPLRALLAADARLAGVTTVFAGADATVVYAPTEQAALALALDAERGAGAAGGEAQAAAPVADRWERTTNLRLFGGLLGLRMESRK